MRKKIFEPLLAEEREEIYKLWSKGDQAAFKWIGRLLREIDQLHKQAEERRNTFFLAHGVEVEQVTPEEAARLYDTAVARREARLQSV
jgi:hypothetical protein